MLPYRVFERLPYSELEMTKRWRLVERVQFKSGVFADGDNPAITDQSSYSFCGKFCLMALSSAGDKDDEEHDGTPLGQLKTSIMRQKNAGAGTRACPDTWR
jgi:hypothetical protein